MKRYPECRRDYYDYTMFCCLSDMIGAVPGLIDAILS